MQILKQRCVVSIAELYLYRGINWGELEVKLEGAPKNVETATNITRAELVSIIKNFYTHGGITVAHML
jgi:hypothetical protein